MGSPVSACQKSIPEFASRRKQIDLNLRHGKITSDVLDAIAAGRTPLVLTERYDHATLLTELLTEKGQRVALLSGKGTTREKQELLQELILKSDEILSILPV